MKSTILCAALATAIGAVAASAQAAVVLAGGFPTAGDAYCSATNGCGTIPAGGQSAFMWTTGDYVSTTSAFTPGTYLITGATDTFQIQNYMGGGNNLTADLFLNGVDIGSFTADDCDYCGTNQTVNFSSTFAPVLVSGPFSLEWVLQNTIPAGGGSIAFLDGGYATLSTSVPEPASWLMMLVGFGAAGSALRGSRRKAGSLPA